MSPFAANAARPDGARVTLRTLFRWLWRAVERHSHSRIRHAVPNYQVRRIRREMLQVKRRKSGPLGQTIA
jgi:hypothetical protein